MLKAAEGPLQKYWKMAEPIAKDEFTKIAQLVEQIGIDRATQKITQEDVNNIRVPKCLVIGPCRKLTIMAFGYHERL